MASSPRSSTSSRRSAPSASRGVDLPPCRATVAKSRTRRSRRSATRGVPRERRAISRAAVRGHGRRQQPRAARDDRLQLGRRVEHQAQRDAEAVAQRRRQQPGAGGGADQGEGRQVDAHRARRRPLADHQVELEILHRRIEDLLDRRLQAVDLVDEQDVVRLQVGQDARRGRRRSAITGPEVARKPTPSSRATICASVVLPRPGRAGEQHVVERLAARCGGLDEDGRLLAQLLLADEVGERLRPQRRSSRPPRPLGGVTRRVASSARSSRQLLQAGADHRVDRRVRTEALRRPARRRRRPRRGR